MDGISLHGGLSLGPVGRADLTVLINELVGLDETKDLGSVATDRGVVHGDVTEDTLGVDDVESTVGVARVEMESTIGSGDGLVDVLQEGDVHVTETSLLAVSVDPSEMGEDGVDGSTNEDSVGGLELRSGLRESDNLGGADEGEVEGVEEENDPLSVIILQRDGLDLLVGENSVSSELRGRSADAGDRDVAVPVQKESRIFEPPVRRRRYSMYVEYVKSS